MDVTVDQALRALNARFGPGFSNGVVGILAHRELPDVFGAEEWKDWTFKPAPAAFDYAHNAGFIVPHKLGSKWEMTKFGKQVAAKIQHDLEKEA